MSILAKIDGPGPIGFAVEFGITIMAFVIAYATGIFRFGAATGPSRIPPGRTKYHVMFVLIAGFIGWVFPQMVYGAILQTQLQQNATQPTTLDASMFTATDWAVLSVAPPVVSLLTMLIGDYVLGGTAALRSLGVLGRPLRNFGWGLLGILLAMPLLYMVSAVAERVYDLIQFEHPQEHDLLRILASHPPAIARYAILFGAVVMAPLFEEMLFRLHLQTFIRSLLTIARKPKWTPSEGVPYQLPDESLDPSMLEYANLATPSAADPSPPAWASWTAIVITSAAFAAVHPRWMWPPIFALSLCLGYGYERTGSIWTSIAMHAAFNGISTIAFLCLVAN